MPMHIERRRKNRSRGRYSELDWFAEDPWAEPDLAALERGEEDEWYPGLWEPSDEETWRFEDSDDETDEDPFNGWGPVRRRRTLPSDEA